jgi:hypothetical protein
MVVAQVMDPREMNLHFHTIPAKIKNSIRTATGDMTR